MRILPPVSIEASRFLPSRWDLLAAILVFGFIIAFADASQILVEPLAALKTKAISLNPSHLPEYALRTALRMLIALGFSLLFTFTYATWAAKSARAGSLLIPLLDILQSVPILGFISITVVFFLSLAPGRVLGAELAAVFAIFTSQAWNMAFSFYQSLRTVPIELTEAGKLFGLNAWTRFWRIEAPFAMPSLVWNMMMSMSGGWFFVVASEAISVGHTTVTLPGIGSYIALAIADRNLSAIFWAIGAMLIVILIYDQLLFRPLVAWADRFRFDQEQSGEQPQSWVLTMLRRSHLIAAVNIAILRNHALDLSPRAVAQRPYWRARADSRRASPTLSGTPCSSRWRRLPCRASAASLHRRISPAPKRSMPACLASLTMLRVFVLIALASLIWTPIGVIVGLQSAACAHRAAYRAISRRLSGQSSVSRRGLPDRDVRVEPRHLAFATDGARHAMVHPVQRDRGRVHAAARTARRDRQSSDPGLAVVAQSSAAGRSFRFMSPAQSRPRADRGTPRSSPSSSPGATERFMRMAWAPILPKRRRRETFTASCSASR